MFWTIIGIIVVFIVSRHLFLRGISGSEIKYQGKQAGTKILRLHFKRESYREEYSDGIKMGNLEFDSMFNFYGRNSWGRVRLLARLADPDKEVYHAQTCIWYIRLNLPEEPRTFFVTCGNASFEGFEIIENQDIDILQSDITSKEI